MTRTAAIVLVLVLNAAWSASMGPGAREAADTKPGSPVSVSIEPSGGVLPPGDVVELVVSVRSSVASDELRLSIAPMGGAELLRGERSMETALEAGGEFVTNITVRMPSAGGGYVRARAALTERGGGRYSGSAIWPASSKETPGPAGRAGGREGTDSRGRRIIEHGGE